ncbi:MAG: DUF624 domain-containing protein [Lachnospiraceae bacterium]|nr:DUF624 domain-containing protein [Lachnospiraceae bacterium]
MKIFDIDGPIMQVLTKIANLMILNFLTILCCIPIFTAGAALTALHYMCLKIIRNEDCYICKGYFTAFKESFKQSTIVWLIVLLVVGVLAGDYYIMAKSDTDFNYWFKAILGAVAIFVAFTITMVFPVMAKFTNTTLQTIKNALALGILHFPKTILMIVLYAIPVLIAITSYSLMPFVLMFGFSGPAYGAAALYNGYFKKLEEQIMERQAAEGKAVVEEEDDGVEKIFSDTLDEALVNKQEQ